ncbi:hypothetical protein M3Y98_00087300 [Aphelenchoides besseyi]|nr:hypothetical protein M3Y98_00087300 [Aphelenchoides besseyi]
MSDRNLAPSAPGSSSSSKIKNSASQPKQEIDKRSLPEVVPFQPRALQPQKPEVEGKMLALQSEFQSSSVETTVAKDKFVESAFDIAFQAAKKRAEKIGPWELSSTTPAIRSPIPISPSSSASPVSPIVPVSSGSSISSTPSAIKVNTSEAVRKINCYIDDVYHGKVDEHGVPITCEWYAKLILKSSCEVKPTNSAVFSASEKAKIPKDNGTIDVSMSMAVNNEQTVKQSQKGRKKPSN